MKKKNCTEIQLIEIFLRKVTTYTKLYIKYNKIMKNMFSAFYVN